MIKIHSRNVGKLIGVRGATIKQMQEEYKVRISISKEDDEDGMRTVDLQGEEQDIQSAIEVISQRFVNESQGNSYEPRQRFQNEGQGNSYERNSGYNQRSDSSRGGYDRSSSGYNQRSDGSRGGYDRSSSGYNQRSDGNRGGYERN